MIKRKITKAKIRNSADESNDSPLGFEATLWAAACNPSFAVLGRFGDEQRRRLFAAGVVFALFGGAMAGPLEDGRAAYQHGDYGVAMRFTPALGAAIAGQTFFVTFEGDEPRQRL